MNLKERIRNKKIADDCRAMIRMLQLIIEELEPENKPYVPSDPGARAIVWRGDFKEIQRGVKGE